MRQSSSGPYSPNIQAEGPVNYLVTNARKRLGIDTGTMLKVIDSILTVAKENGVDNEGSVDSIQDLNLKIKERFSEYEEQLTAEYRELMGCYGMAYRDALNSAVADEVDYRETLNMLKRLSQKILEGESYNPMAALEKLKEIFIEKFENADGESFSEGAIRYYLIHELIACNVFPNLVEHE